MLIFVMTVHLLIVAFASICYYNVYVMRIL